MDRNLCRIICLYLLQILADARLDPDLYEARAIVLGKMGEHHQALKIYVYQLKDHAKAEE